MTLKLPAGPHITGLMAENFQKLRAVRLSFTPGAGLIQITGPNGSGKTSVFDAIFACLAGKKVMGDVPIRLGEESLRVELSIGPVLVTLRHTEKSTSFTVRTEDGAMYPRPVELLSELFGPLAFDGPRFDRMDPKQRLEVLRNLVPVAADIDALNAQNAAEYSARTDAGRVLRQLEAEFAAMPAPALVDLPAEPVSTAAILERMSSASALNAERDADAVARSKMGEEIEAAYRAAERYREEAARLTALAEANVEHAKREAARLEAMPPIREAVDTATLTEELAAAQATNRAIAERDARRAKLRAIETTKEAIESYTQSMAAREREKAAAIAAAPMPVPGLGFGNGDVTFNGVPYAQASTAERTRIWAGIAMAGDPKLKVIFLRDASLLDADSLAIVMETAEAKGFEVLGEFITPREGVGIQIIEMRDGSVVGGVVGDEGAAS